MNSSPRSHTKRVFFFRTKKDLLDNGIEKSKKFLACMFRHVQNALDMRQVVLAGPFLYLVIQEVSFNTLLHGFLLHISSSFHSRQGTLNAKYYSNPDCLWLLATFALRAYVAASRKTKSARLPLIASAPLEEGYCLIVGVPPVAETSPRRYLRDQHRYIISTRLYSNAFDFLQFIWQSFRASGRKNRMFGGPRLFRFDWYVFFHRVTDNDFATFRINYFFFYTFSDENASCRSSENIRRVDRTTELTNRCNLYNISHSELSFFSHYSKTAA